MTSRIKLAGVLLAAVTMLALTASSSSAVFTSSFYPATPYAFSTADVIDAFGSTVKCTENTFDVEAVGGGLIISATETVRVKPSYKNCSAFGLPATVNFTGCTYILHNQPSSTNIVTDLACPAGTKGVTITAYTSGAHTTVACHVTITPFTGWAGLQVHNFHPGLVLTGTVTGLTLLQERVKPVLCPPGTETKEAKYTVQPGGITFTGYPGQTLSVS